MSYPDRDKADDRGRVFREAEDALALSEQDTFPMGAPNKQPAKQGGMKAPSSHAPHSAGVPASKTDLGNGGVGGEVKRGTNPKGTGRNKNRLH